MHWLIAICKTLIRNEYHQRKYTHFSFVQESIFEHVTFSLNATTDETMEEENLFWTWDFLADVDMF